MKAISKSLKKNDPNHLNLGIRYGYIEQLDDELLRISKESFDALSFNCYALSPDHEKMNHALEISGLPMIIGEYHFGTVDRGLAQSLWQVNSQKERGDAFRYYTENAFAHRGLIGTGWFRWIDQNINGRTDGENYNCGFIDVTDIWSMRLSKQPNRYMKYIPVQKRLSIKRLTPWDTLPYPISGNK